MKLRSILIVLCFAALAPFQFGASCASSGNDSGRDDNGGEWVRGVPRSATLVREGHGKVKWTPDASGTVWVYGQQEGRVLFRSDVRRDQEVVVIPDDDKIYLDGRVVYNDNLERDGAYAIYFGRESRGGYGGAGGYGNSGGGGNVPDSLRGAQRVASGSDLRFKARSRGTIFVYDRDAKDVVYRADIERNQTIEVLPSDNEIRVDGRPSRASYRLDRKHAYEIYFRE